MPLFQYVAISTLGKEKKGTINADSERSARDKLRTEGLITIEMLSVSRQTLTKKTKVKSIDKKISSAELSLMTRELYALISGGLEIEQSIASLAEQTENKKLQQIIKSIHSQILEGYSLSAGLNDFPKAFTKVYIATIKAGEESGHLAAVLEHLADYLDKQEQMRQKVIQAIIYPSILTSMSFAIVTFLLTYVTPKIVEIFENSKASLPWVTNVLLNISHFIQQYGLFIFIILTTFYIILRRSLTVPSIKARYDHFLLKLPIIGKTIQLVETSRFLRTMAILTQATVPVIQSFHIAADLVNSSPIRESILNAKNRVKEGATIYLSLKKCCFFNASTLQFIASGENAGNLDDMLIRAAHNQERHVQFTMNTFLTAFEPVLILLMGIIVLFIVLATLLPIFQLSNMLG